ncbi:MAG: T9SS type A sorting domain-containing protein [Chitinophagaceae bacterium]|nr:T9SS type A sorting domain-containing protein [Chitinophagaceae bacterium]MCB9047528.1 T9SS type A sorting domain-containing protein [Chitinophagales bacterium]
MKWMLSIAVMFIICDVSVHAQQNLVHNGNFEQYIACPSSYGSIDTCTGWSGFSGTVDFYHTCASSVPSNAFGYQFPASGSGYVGIADFSDPQGHGIRESFQSKITPMQAGGTYDVSLSVSVGEYAKYFTNGLCVHFFIDSLVPVTNTQNIPSAPSVNFLYYGLISDTSGWVRLQTLYQADSAYSRILIGCFLDTPVISYSLTGFPNTHIYGYWYIDSVVVKLAKNIGVNYRDSLACAGDTIRVPYFVSNPSYFYQSNNVFTLQLSNASGSFANPVNIGTKASNSSDTIIGVIPTNTTTGAGYRIRLVSSNGQDTSFNNGVDIGIGSGIVKPVAYNNSPSCYNDTLRMSASTTTQGAGYRWVGPGNFTSGIQNPYVPNPVPANGGNYIVTAHLYGCEAKDTTTAIVYAGSAPANTTATYNYPVCADDTLKLFGTASGSSNTYSWTGPGNYSSTIQNPVFANATTSMSGNYVLYASSGLCVSRDSISVVVRPRPANFTTSVNSPLCAGETIFLSASSTSTGVSYIWSGPNGFNSTNPGPFISGAVPAHNGYYYVTATLNGCTLDDTLTVQVKPLPNKPVAGSNTPICSGETLNFTSLSTSSNVSYSWTGPNSYTSAQQNPSISNTTTGMSGNYIVSAMMNGCISKDTATVLVKPLPTATTTSNSGPECVGDTLYINIGTSSTGATYTWTGPNSFIANTQNTYVANSTVAATGWYVATVDLNGCSFKDSTQAMVYPIPPTPTVSYSSPLCAGETLQLLASSVSGASYNWTGQNNFTSITQNPVLVNVQVNDTGTYKVTATVNGCTSAEGSTIVNINPLPFVTIFPMPGDTICSGDKVSFTALPNNHAGTPMYKWFVNGFPVGVSTISYSSTTLKNGDVVRCDMTEFTKCSSAYTDQSNDVDMKVLPWLAPSVTITAYPNRTLQVDEYITFTAVVINGGPFPKYQWKRNGKDIVGATGFKWSANTIDDNDVISVEVTSDYKCPQPDKANSNGIVVNVLTGIDNINAKYGDMLLFPNPNNGSFTLKGQAETNGLIQLSVINTVGQVVYTERITPMQNNIDRQINTGLVVPGIYLLKIQTAESTSLTRFTVK